MTTYRQCITTWKKCEKEIFRFTCFVGGRKSFGQEIHKERSMNVNVNAWGRAVVEKAMEYAAFEWRADEKNCNKRYSWICDNCRKYR